ncbi:MAG: helix-turn-helix transcriptional regulator [Lachnospiraceae bacterium]|nr:helix-turn-helix transcriptional regulator [Lachnospiraceae bacterium]
MISYEPLIKTLQERGIKRSDLRQHMSSATIAKLANNEFVSLKTIDTICRLLHCRVDEVIVYIEENENDEPMEGNEPT